MYECLFTIETTQGKIYKCGDKITKEEYNSLCDADKQFFMLGKLEYSF